MKCNLTIDVGNSHIVFGVFENDILLQSWRLKSDKTRTGDEYFSVIQNLIKTNMLDSGNFRIAVLASVVPVLSNVFVHLIKKYFACPVINVNAFTDLGLSFPMKDPGFIGADLIVNAFAAKEIFKENCIVCDFGTATTIQLVGKNGYFYGTVISPVVITSANELFKNASLLSNIEIGKAPQILGINTKDALQSGIVTGNVFMIDGFVRAIKKEYKNIGFIKTIATGGIAQLICENSNEVDIIDKDLTLKGLNLISKL